jgi:8-oxo-dGTP pyrophosphatase MutT (NUDIX family)
VIDSLVIRLRESRPPADLAREALARLPGDLAAHLFPRPLIPAAVLVSLVPREAGWEVLLTRRTDQLRDHPGQISFPGGRLEPGDDGPLAAAVREAREEVGIEPEYIDVVGYLPPHAVITGFAVSPVVAILRPGFALHPDPSEVAEIFGVPLDYLLDSANFIAGERTVRGIRLPMYSCQYGAHLIWGATAQILHTLRESIHAADQ